MANSNFQGVLSRHKWVLGILLFCSVALGAKHFQDVVLDGLTINDTTASTVLYSDASKVVTSSAVTPTELAYLVGQDQALGSNDSPTFTSVSGGNLTLTGNTLSSTDTDGDINITPDGVGDVVIPTADLVVTAGDLNVTAGDINLASGALISGAIILNDDGSAAAPSISFTLDTDTGFFRDTADQVAIAVGGTKGGAFTKTAGGFTNFGIGLYSTSDSIPFYVLRTQNGSTGMNFVNQNAGAGANTNINLETDLGVNLVRGQVIAFSQASTLTSLADRVSVRAMGGSGVSLTAEAAGMDIRFYHQGFFAADEFQRFTATSTVFSDLGTIVPNSKLVFDVLSTTRASKPWPSMTTTQRGAIATPATAGMIWNSTLGYFEFYSGAFWDYLIDSQSTVVVSNKRLLSQSGTNSLPAYAFASDTNTGLFSSGTDEIGFSSGGTEVALLGPTGLTLDLSGSLSLNTDLIFETVSTTKASIPAPLMTETQRDALTNERGSIIYNTDTDALNYYNNTTWQEVGAGGGSGTGAKNYFTDGDFESNIDLADGYDDSGAYVDGDGGTFGTIFTLSSNATTPLRDTADLKIFKNPVVDSSGYGITLLSESIERADQGRQLYFKGEFDFSHADYPSGDVCLYAYDVAGGVILPVVPVSGLDADGCIEQGKGKVLAKILTSSSTTGAVRVSLHTLSDSDTTNDYTAYVDDAELGPDGTVPGAIIGNPITFSPSWTNITVGNGTEVFTYTRVGKKMHIEGILTLGSTSSVGATPHFTTPGGVTADFNTGDIMDGVTHYFDTGTPANNQLGAIHGFSTNEIYLRAAGAGNISSTSPFTWATGDQIDIDMWLTIDEWEASAALSTTQVNFKGVSAHYEVDGSSANLSIADEAFEQLDLNSKIEDTHNTVTTGASWVFTSPASQYYLVSSHIQWSNTTNMVSALLELRKNGSRVAVPGGDGGASVITPASTYRVYLAKDDTLSIWGYQNDSASGARSLSSTAANRTTIHIRADFDPTYFSVYGETDKVSDTSVIANYTATAGQYTDLASVVLTPGEWDIYGNAMYYSNGATTTTTAYLGISSTSGNSGTGLTEGDNMIYITKRTTTATYDPITIAPYTVIVTTPTTYYLKGRANTSITNLQFSAKMWARKIK